MMKRIIEILPFVGLFCFLQACESSQGQQERVITKQTFCLNDQLKKSTSIIALHEQPIQEQLTLSGKIEYDENDMVTFRSLLDGVVEQVKFELGDQVRKGQTLATIKSTQIQELYQQKRQQENQIEHLKKGLKSKKELLADGLASMPEVLEIERELENAQIELARVQENLQLYRAVGDGYFQILAPKDGYVIQKSISAGQIITADSESLFAVSNLKEVWVMVNIYASNLRHIHVGDEVKVRTIAYPDTFYTGKIDKIYNVFDDNEHVLKARVVLANPKLDLMPGLSADIVINMKNNFGTAYAIPNKAKIFHNNKEYILVYKEDCDIQARRINPIAHNEEYTFVAEPMFEGEKIIASNALLIFEELSKITQ